MAKMRGYDWSARWWLRPWFYRVLVVWGAITAVTSVAMVGVEFVNARAMRAWPTTSGRIEASNIRTVHYRRALGGYDRYEPHVEYSYNVAGHAYRGARILVGTRAMYKDLDVASADLARDYPVGRAVQVYYKPDDPAEAILEQDNFYWGPFIMLPVGFLMLGAGVLLRRRVLRARTA